MLEKSADDCRVEEPLVLLFKKGSWQRHWPWAVACIVITALAAGAYAAECSRRHELLGGSSLTGFTCGTLGGLLILYEFSFIIGRRKRPATLWLRQPAQVRLRRHIWLGLLVLPLVVLHSGLMTRGSPLAITVLAVCLAVIASGIWGLLLQQFLPERLLLDVPGETIASQIPQLAEQLSGEAELLVLATCGPRPLPRVLRGVRSAAEATSPVGKNLAWVRAQRAKRGGGLLTDLPPASIPDTEPLRDYFEQTIQPFLRGADDASVLQGRNRSTQDFQELRGKINPAAHAIVDRLEGLCERRRQLDRQARLHGRLHRWLWVHLPLSASLVLLLAWHVITAIVYW
jgi:hypothetical protein